MRIALFTLLAMLACPSAAHADCTAQHKQARALRDTLASVGQTTPEYRAMMLKRIQEAESAAANCDRAVADAKRADEERVAVRKREMEAEAKREAVDRFSIDELRSRPEFLRIAWSAFECSYEKTRDTILGNPFASAEQKEELKRAELMLARIRATMKFGKLAQLACRTEDVAKLAFCLADENANAACSEATMALRVRAEKAIVAAVQLNATPAPLMPDELQAKSAHDDMQILKPQF